MIMIVSPENRLIDTIIDTKNILVSVNCYYRIRPKTKDPMRSKIILHLTGGKQKRERIDLHIEINTKDWIEKQQQLVSNSENNNDINLFTKPRNYLIRVGFFILRKKSMLLVLLFEKVRK
jgi:hypothetical protein